MKKSNDFQWSRDDIIKVLTVPQQDTYSEESHSFATVRR